MVKHLIFSSILSLITLSLHAQIPIKKFIPSTFVIDSALHKEMRDSGFSYEFNRWIQIADMNNDGKTDIVLQPYEHPKRRDGVVSVFYNQSGDTTPLFKNNKPFSFYTLGDPAQFTVGDVNGDRRPDILAPTQNYHGKPEDKPVFLYPDGGDHTPDKLFLQTPSGFKSVSFPDNFNTETGNLLDIDGTGNFKTLVSNYTKPMEDWNLRVPAVNTELFPDLNWNDHVAGRNTIYDFNGDGIPDIITYKRISNTTPLPPIFYINDYTGKVLYSFNLKEFKPNVRDSLNNIIYDYSDLNGDGKLDIVLSYMGEWWIGGNTPFDGGRTRFFGINTFILINKGDMTFDITEIIDEPNYVQFNVTLSDWDFDGKIDILVSGMQDGIYYKNIDGNLFERRTITPLFKQAINLRGIDFDRDGKQDFVNLYVNQKDENGNYASSDFSQVLSVVTSTGAFNYSVTGKVIEKNIYIGPNTISAERINMVDGDADGDLDLIIGYIQTENNAVSFFQEFYENNGTSFVFKPGYIEIDKSLYGELQVWSYDIDRDGDLDLFYPTYRKSQALAPVPGPKSTYFWWENTGKQFKISKKLNLNFTESNMLYQYDLYTDVNINNKQVDTLVRNSVFESYIALPPPRQNQSWKHFISIGMIRSEDPGYNYFAVQDWTDNGRKLEKINILSFKKGAKLSIFEKSDTIAIIPIVEQVFTKNSRNDVYRYAPVQDWGMHIHDLDKDGKLEVITMEYPNYTGPYDFDMPAGARIQVYDKTGNISDKFLDSALQYDPQKISSAGGITMTDLNGDGLIDILPFTGWGWRSWQNKEIDFWPKIDTQRYIKRVILNTGKRFKDFHLDLSNRSEDFIQQQIGYAHYYPFDFNNTKEKSILVLKGLNQSLNAVPAIQLDYAQFKFPCSENQPPYKISIDSFICGSSDTALIKIDSVPGYQTRWFKNGTLLGTKHMFHARDTGIYQLVVTNLGGCEVSRMIEVKFHPRANTSFQITSSAQCLTGNNFAFTNTSTISSGTLTHIWNFGDGGSATTANASRAYAAAGNYNVKLVTTSSFGCRDSITRQVTVHPMPAKPTINWDGINLSTASTYASYQWLLNNSAVTGANAAEHKPVNPGSYRVRITNTPGCADTSDAFNLVVTAAGRVTQNQNKVAVYPNPATSSVFIDLGKSPSQPVSVQLLTIEGRPMTNWIMQQQRQEFAIDHIQNGTYLIQIIEGKTKTIHKVVIQTP